MSDRDSIYYFGCWDRPGHFLWDHTGKWVSDYHVRRFKLPTAGQLDGGTLFLPQEVIGRGAITYLPAPNLTILAWWGNNPWDGRGKVNQAIICVDHSGSAGETVMWQMFTRYFPDLEKLLKRPVID